jgi:hypothetical protein
MKTKAGEKKIKPITAEEFDKAVFVRVRRVNVDFPDWMIKMLDQEALKLNVSRQAVIKMWIRERLDPHRRLTL